MSAVFARTHFTYSLPDFFSEIKSRFKFVPLAQGPRSSTIPGPWIHSSAWKPVETPWTANSSLLIWRREIVQHSQSVWNLMQNLAMTVYREVWTVQILFAKLKVFNRSSRVVSGCLVIILQRLIRP